MSHSLLCLDLPAAKINQLENKKIETVEALAEFFPRRYYDFRTVKNIYDCEEGDLCVVQGQLDSLDTRDSRMIKAVLRDSTGDLRLIWYNCGYLSRILVEGVQYTIAGKVSSYYGIMGMTNPVLFSRNPSDVCKLLPVYSKVKGMSSEYLLKSINMAISFLRAGYCPTEKDLLAKRLGLKDLFSAYKGIHEPGSLEDYKASKRRIDFERIYAFYESLYRKGQYTKPVSGFRLTTLEKTRCFIDGLPFSLTDGQKEAVSAIQDRMTQGKRLEMLITGDVGCGKTLVAIVASLGVIENGAQSVIMAPTLVLAKQHYTEFSARLQPFGVRCALLTGETKKRERTKLLKELKDGEIDILIGTHAVLGDDVAYKSLALTIIDEEHKFGVTQKEKIEKIDALGVHHLSMTATPIPRSLAMTIYGNRVEVIQIRSMPQGRKPVDTSVVRTKEAGFKAILREVESGHQAYVICPFINESDSDQFKDVASVQVIFQELVNYCKSVGSSARVGLINGDMKQSEVVAQIDKFAAGEMDILLSTTIVEVGVNVPNATAILIMSSERFGLAALHQLRGRVGRSSLQSFCYLCSGVGRSEKLELFCSTTDGFVIAEEDLRLRGPGDLVGEDQAGASEAIRIILQRPKMSALIRDFLEHGTLNTGAAV